MTMDHGKATTPPATLSRASTVFLDNSSRGTPTMTPPLNAMDGVKDFKPYQSLMDIPISVEYGQDLTTKQVMHEGILRCHSKVFEQYCTQAKPLREQYAQITAFKEKVAPFVFPEITMKKFLEDCRDLKVIPLIIQAYDKYPISAHQSGIKKVVDDAIEDQVTQKNTKPDPSTMKSKSKDSRDFSRSTSLATRLTYLKPQGVYGVATDLYGYLHRIVKMYQAKAKTDPMSAAVQQRLLLHGADDTNVKGLKDWIYGGSLYYQDAAQLYSLLDLATKLGIDALTETCLNNLANDFSDAIRQAHLTGIPLHTLLEHGQQPANSVVDVVVVNVFKDEAPPRRLLKLVVETLADNLDMDLWAHLKDVIGHSMALRLIEATIARQHSKVGQHDRVSVKSESDDAATERSMSIASNDHQLAHMG